MVSGFMRSSLVPLLLLCATPSLAWAGESLSLYDKLARSALVIELRVPLDEPLPESWPNQGYDPQGLAFPDQLVAAGRERATVERVLVGAGDLVKLPVPEQPWVFGSASACWWLAHQRGAVRSLLFLQRGGPSGWQQVYGVEHEWGTYSDLNADYDLLVVAITRASGWVDERARAVDAAVLWQDQRQALAGDDPYLLGLTREFLLAHDAGEVLDEVWGAPGTPGRASREAAAQWPEDHGRCSAM
jgi:hypothetical protein